MSSRGASGRGLQFARAFSASRGRGPDNRGRGRRMSDRGFIYDPFDPRETR